MAKVKTKKQRQKRAQKRLKTYVKPEHAIGCRAYGGKTYAEARMFVLSEFEHKFIAALRRECGDNISEMSRRADVGRSYVRKFLRQAGLMS